MGAPLPGRPLGQTSDDAVTDPADEASVISLLKGIVTLSGGGGGGSSAVTIADGADATQGAKADAAAATDTSTASIVSFWKRLLQRITVLIGQLPAALTAGGNLKTALQEAIPAGTNNIGDVDVLSIAAGDNNIGNVDLASAIPAGTNNIGDVDIASAPTGSSSISIQGTVAHDAADADNPLKVGGKAYDPDSPPTNAASGDRVNSFHDLAGRYVTYLATRLDAVNDAVGIGKGPLGAPNYANGQVTSGSAATLVAARATRRKVWIKNTDGTNGVYIGAATVTSNNGYLLKANEEIQFETTALIQCLAAAGTPVVCYIEIYD